MTAPTEAGAVLAWASDDLSMPWASRGPVLGRVADRVRARLAAEAAAEGESPAAHPASISDAD